MAEEQEDVWGVPRGLTIRVTASHACREEMRAILESMSSGHQWVYCAEGTPEGDGSPSNPREHFHAWFIPPPHFHQHTLRNTLVKSFGKGNGRYSISKARDDVRAVAYFMKGGDYVTGDGVDASLLERARGYDEKVKARKLKYPDTRRRAIVREVGELPPHPGEEGHEYLERVVGVVLDHHINTGRMADVRSIQSVTRAVIALSSARGRRDTVQSIVQSMQTSVRTRNDGRATPAMFDPYARIVG